MGAGAVGTVVLLTSFAPIPPGRSATAAASPSPVGQVLAASGLQAAQAMAQTSVTWQLQAAKAKATADAAKAVRRRAGTSEPRVSASPTPAKASTKKKVPTTKMQAAPPSATVRPSVTPAAAASASSGASAVVAFAKAQLGKPYVLGGTGPGSFDCSGLVQAAYLTIGVSLPRVSEAQSTAGTQVSLSDLQPGDILYWGSAGSASHVAIYVGGGMFVGAQNPSDGVAEHPLDYSPPTGAVRVI